MFLLDKNYGLYYSDTDEWLCNHEKQVFVMTVGDAKHVRSILAKNSPEPVQVKLYEGDNSVVYNGPLLEFER